MGDFILIMLMNIYENCDSYNPGDGHVFMSAPVIQLLCYWIYVSAV